jgi:hypothetical protein
MTEEEFEGVMPTFMKVGGSWKAQPTKFGYLHGEILNEKLFCSF